MGKKNLKNILEEHITYEVVMLHNSKCYIENFQKSKDEVGEFISLESFLLHGRNIIEFIFYKSNKEYSRAADFFQKDQWNKIKPNMSKTIKIFIDRANTELSHLTYKRQDGKTKKKEWEYNEIILDILNCVKLFLDNIPDEYKYAKIEKISKILQLYSA